MIGRRPGKDWRNSATVSSAVIWRKCGVVLDPEFECDKHCAFLADR